ncbi:MAG: alpha/beta hydrolase [Planctomycetia bacterium]
MLRSGFAAVVVTFALLSPAVADEPPMVRLWPGDAPGEKAPIDPETIMERGKEEKTLTRRVTNVSAPMLAVYRPSGGAVTKTGVIVAPGGGYAFLSWDLEGVEVAKRLNEAGVTAFVLKYRVPRRPGDDANLAPLQDAQRAIRLVRSRAAQWNLDPRRIGMLGFSAGGNLTVNTCTNPNHTAYRAVDAADEFSPRPDFAVLVYPGYLTKEGTTDLRPDVVVTKDAPPMFFAHALDDHSSPDNSIAVFQALRKVGVPTELHIYTTGGHGFGLRPTVHPCHTWPDRAVDWMKSRGQLDQ